MTIETSCYVCGKEMLCLNGLCPECTWRDLTDPGRAYAATFGLFNSAPTKGDDTEGDIEGDDIDKGREGA